MIKKINRIFSKEQKILAIIIFILSLIGALLETLGVYIISPFSDILLSSENAFSSGRYAVWIGFFGLNTPIELVVFMAFLIIVVYVFKNTYSIFLSWIRAKYTAKVQRELSIAMMQNYMSKGYPFFVEHNTSALMRGVQTDVSNVYMTIFHLIKLVTDVLTVLLIAGYLLFVDWQLAIGVGVMAVFCFAVFGRAFSKITFKAGKESRTLQEKSNKALLHAFQGAKEVIALRKEKFFIQEYGKYLTASLATNARRVVFGEIPIYIIEGLCVTAIFLIIIWKVLVGGISGQLIAVLASFVVAAFRILPTVGRITSEYTGLSFCYPSIEAMYNHIVELETSKANCENTQVNINNEALIFEKSIKVDKVSFSYEKEFELRKWVLNNLSLEIEKGDAVAFIGPSGAGKTTLADLILGLLKPNEGKIIVDGRSIHSDPIQWSKMIAYVSQTMYITDDTIRANVAFGEANIDDKKVWECIKLAQLDAFVNELDDGIYTKVGEQGVRFSGGQRQRIAIARALYHEPEIIVLDEATSALDGETEKAVMESIEALHGKRTLIIVAHRLTTVKNCDKIYEIKEGKAREIPKDSMRFE